jgi:hypothetical protein
MARTQSPDTHPEAERVQLELFRRASPARRVQLALSLSDAAIALSRRAISRQDPAASAQEVGLRFVALHYGDDLAARLRAYLASGARR